MPDKKALPDAALEVKALPDAAADIKPAPQTGNPENTVVIGGVLAEIKPTKLKYQRNRTAIFYRALEMYPLPSILAMGEGAFDPNRDSDKCLMDWLIAVTDNEPLILANYDEIDTGTVEKLLAIFRRVNKIDEKEEKLKNETAERKEAV